MVAESSKMDTNGSDDLTTVMFREDTFIARFGLSVDNVLEYFAMSQFYDARCNNHKIRMQNLDPSVLTTMPGLEYQAALAAPNLFTITKVRRTVAPAPAVEPLAVYYVFCGNIYQVPTMHAVLSSRLLQTLHYVRSAFASVNAAAALSNQGKYRWDPAPVPDQPPSTQRSRFMTKDMADFPTEAERSAIDDVLYDVLMKNRRIAAAHDSAQNKSAPGSAAPPQQQPQQQQQQQQQQPQPQQQQQQQQ